MQDELQRLYTLLRVGLQLNYIPRLWNIHNFGALGLFILHEGTAFSAHSLTLCSVLSTVVAVLTLFPSAKRCFVGVGVLFWEGL